MLRVEYAPFLSSKQAYCPLECRARCLQQQLEMNAQGTCPLCPYGSLAFSGCKKGATNMNLSPRQRNTERTWCLTSVASEGPPCYRVSKAAARKVSCSSQICHSSEGIQRADPLVGDILLL